MYRLYLTELSSRMSSCVGYECIADSKTSSYIMLDNLQS